MINSDTDPEETNHVTFTDSELDSVERAIQLDLRQSEAGGFQIDADYLRNALEKVRDAR